MRCRVSPSGRLPCFGTGVERESYSKNAPERKLGGRLKARPYASAIWSLERPA